MSLVGAPRTAAVNLASTDESGIPLPDSVITSGTPDVPVTSETQSPNLAGNIIAALAPAIASSITSAIIPQGNDEDEQRRAAVSPSSNVLMQDLLGSAAQSISTQIGDTVEQVSQEVSNSIQQAITQKIASTEPEDVLRGLSNTLFTSLTEESGEVNDMQAQNRTSNPQFELSGAVQIFGAVIAVIGMLLLVGNGLNKEAAQPQQRGDEQTSSPDPSMNSAHI
jgi:hypothetical protein